MRKSKLNNLESELEELKDDDEDDGGLDVTINSHRVTEDDVEEAGGKEEFDVEDIDGEPVKRTRIEDLDGDQQSSTTYPREGFEPGELTDDE